MPFEPADPVTFRLADVDPRSVADAPGDRAATEAATAQTVTEIAHWQERLWADSSRALLVVFQAIDTGGKDGVVKKVFTGVNPQGVKVHAFRAPTDRELAHDFLWRVHQVCPARGEIAVFVRSHYEDVLAARVRGLVAEAQWRSRYETIRGFERLLAAEGTTVVKFLLHISREEQGRRLRARLEDPAKQWKFRSSDLDDRRRWADYQAAFEDAVRETSTAHAPWYVVPADRKWYRNYVVGSVVASTLRAMNPQVPAPSQDLDGVVID